MTVVFHSHVLDICDNHDANAIYFFCFRVHVDTASEYQPLAQSPDQLPKSVGAPGAIVNGDCPDYRGVASPLVSGRRPPTGGSGKSLKRESSAWLDSPGRQVPMGRSPWPRGRRRCGIVALAAP